MCLAVSGRILAIRSQPPPARDAPGMTSAGGTEGFGANCAGAEGAIEEGAGANGAAPGSALAAGADADGADADGVDTSDVDTSIAGADDALWRVAEVDFGGVRQQVSLACLPEARVGDRVLVHVGLAIARVEPDEAEAPPTG